MTQWMVTRPEAGRARYGSRLHAVDPDSPDRAACGLAAARGWSRDELVTRKCRPCLKTFARRHGNRIHLHTASGLAILSEQRALQNRERRALYLRETRRFDDLEREGLWRAGSE